MLWLKPGEVAELATQQYFALELVTRRQHFLFNSLNFPYFRKKKERINFYILGKDVGHGLYDSSAELAEKQALQLILDGTTEGFVVIEHFFCKIPSRASEQK